MKGFRKSFVNKIIAFVLVLFLLADALPFTSYAVNEEGNQKPEQETVKTEEPEKKETQVEQPKPKETQIAETQAEEPERKESQTQETQEKETQAVGTQTQETQAQETQVSEPETEQLQTTEPGTEETQITEPKTEETELKTEETEETEQTEVAETEPQETTENETDNAAEGGTPEAMTYDVTVSKEGEGKIEINQEETLTASVEEGKSAEIRMTPADNYRVKDILIDSSSVIQNPVQDVSYTEDDDNTSKLVIENINAAKNVTIQFENIPADESKTIDDLLHISESAETEKGRLLSETEVDGIKTYIYSKTTTLVLKDAADSSDVQFRIKEKEKAYTNWTAALEISSTCELEEVQMRNRNKCDTCVVKNLSNTTLIIDTENPTVEIAPDEPNGENGYYTSDFTVSIHAGDSVSGIASVEYLITDEENAQVDKASDSRWKKIVSASGDANAEAEIETDANGNVTAKIKIATEKYNTDWVRVWIKIKDKADNEWHNWEGEGLPTCFPVNTIAPTIRVSAQDSQPFDARTITITVVDRALTFVKENIMLDISATDIDGNAIDDDTVETIKNAISGEDANWVTTEDGKKHTVTIEFKTSAYYKWEIKGYKNKAGLCADLENMETEGENIWEFTVDTQAPQLELKYETKVFNKMLDVLTFNLFANYEIEIKGTVTDPISGTDEENSPIEYYKTVNGGDVLTRDALEKIYQDGGFSKDNNIISAQEGAYVVYARAVDKAGNVSFVCTDNIIFDMTKSEITIVPQSLETVTAHEDDGYGIYREDFGVDITVSEMKKGDAKNKVYSGIKTIKYSIIKEYTDSTNKERKEYTVRDKELFHFDENQPKKAGKEAAVVWDETGQLVYTYSDRITVPAAQNESCKVYIKVNTVDNAGNEAESLQLTLKDENGKTQLKKWLDIDTTPPDVSIAFQDKNQNENGLKENYYNAERTATLKIVERTAHFDGDAAINAIRITSTDDKGNTKIISTKKKLLAEGFLSTDQWTTKEGDTPNQASQSIKLHFVGDARYKIDFNYTDEDGQTIVYKDRAGNESNHLEDAFTVDKTAPTGSVTVVPKKHDELGSISVGEACVRSEKDSITEEVLFGFSNVSIDVSAEGSDNISPVKIEYYQTDSTEPMSAAQLEKVEFQEFQSSVFKEEQRLVLYFRLRDYAGNATYLRTDGWIIDKTASTVVKFEPANMTEENEPVYYNSDIDVSVEAQDNDSGIQRIEYWVVKDGTTQTQKEVLFPEKASDELSDKKLAYAGIKMDETRGFQVVSEKNNSCDVEVFVKITDNAGNVVTQSKKYDIDITPPEITITYDNNKATNKRYFNSDRTATIRIKEREHHFDGEKVIDGIKITGHNNKNKQLSGIKKSEMISGWTLEKGNSPDDSVFTAQIKYTKDANYQFIFHDTKQEEEKNKYRDKAGNLSGEINWGDSVVPEEFTVDKTKPVVSITASPEGGESKTWDKLLNSRTFAIRSNSGIGVSASYEDETAGIDKVQYYKSTDDGAISEKNLSGRGWKDFKSLTISPNEQAAIYLKVTDKSGNTTYVSTDGLVADNMAPTITLRLEVPESGIYNSDVTVFVDVQEPLSAEQYAGLKNISYKVLNMGKETQNGTLVSFGEQAPSRSQLVGKWTGEIKVDSSLNNSNDVVVEVYASDNAENTATQKTELQIDVTKPTIEVRYDSNTPDSERYYREPRTATIVVTERNFDAKDIEINITNEDGVIPVVSEWAKQEGDGNLDNTTHTATITYSDDGDYTFDMKYIDVAENECEGVTYAEGTANETEFTIDTTPPAIQVSYDNNDAQNNEYFKEGRTATITITEHNFDVGRVTLTQTALLEGRGISIPNARWQDNGDVHTAVIPYSEDGDYTFDVAMTDMAGNENGGVSYAPENAAKSFTIDTVIEEPVITGVENGKAYKGDVVPVITLSDANFDAYEAVLTRTRLEEKDVDVTEQFLNKIVTGNSGGSAEHDKFEAIQENDGIYTLYVKMNDKAGNESENTVQFTLNRFGSVYAYNDYLINLIQNGGGYVQSVEEDLVITEYNADKLVNGSVDIEITRDGKPLEAPRYTISPEVNNQVSVGESGWYQYRYNISAENFKSDGIYKISVASKDETGNAPENTNYKDKGILFTVDSAAPELTSITGLENSIVNASELTVNYTAYDTVGMKSISIYLNGNLYGDVITDFGGDINNYTGSFTIQEADKAQNIRIVVEDLAGNITDTASEAFESAYAFHSAVTVSTSVLVRFFANKLLMAGVIGACGVLAAAVLGTILYRKKKGMKNGE